MRPPPASRRRSRKQELVALTKQYQGMVQMAMSFDVEQAARQLEGPVQLIYFLAMIPDLPLEKSQHILEADTNCPSWCARRPSGS